MLGFEINVSRVLTQAVFQFSRLELGGRSVEFRGSMISGQRKEGILNSAAVPAFAVRLKDGQGGRAVPAALVLYRNVTVVPAGFRMKWRTG